MPVTGRSHFHPWKHKHFLHIKTYARTHARRARNKIKACSSHSYKDPTATRRRNIAVIGITPPNVIAIPPAPAILATTGAARVIRRITPCCIVPKGNSLSPARPLTRIRLRNDKHSGLELGGGLLAKYQYIFIFG